MVSAPGCWAARPSSRWTAAWQAALVPLLAGLTLADTDFGFFRLLETLHP